MRAAECAECSMWHGQPGYTRLVDRLGLGHGREEHRIYQALWYGGITTIAEFDRWDPTRRQIKRIGPRALELIRARYVAAAVAGDELTDLRRAAKLAARMPQAWGARLATAFEAAADTYEYCQRINARHSDRVPELPDPSAEELAQLARAMLADACEQDGAASAGERRAR